MSAAKRGYTCLFLNKFFYDHGDTLIIDNTRHGAQEDISILCDIFTKFKFETKNFVDLTKDKILGQLDALLKKRSVLELHDAFVAIFSSHGNTSLIYDKYCNELPIDKIMERFSNENCPGLAHKPKILIFLCCRGG